MKNSTDHMSQATHNMDQNTQRMAEHTENLAKRTEELTRLTEELTKLTEKLESSANNTYLDLRQAQAAELRRSLWETMDRATNLESKVIEAAKYIQSFEFQVWKGGNHEPGSKQALLLAQAIEEFLGKCSGEIRSPLRIDLLDSSNNQLNLYAIALTLERININQKGASHYSLLNLVKEGLSLRPALLSGKIDVNDLMPYQIELYKYEEVAQYLLALRMNLSAMVAVAKLSSLASKESSFIERTYHAFRMSRFPWHAQTSGYNPVQINYFANLLNQSSQLLIFLKQIESDHEIDNNLRKILKHMVIITKPLPPQNLLSLHQRAVQNLNEAHQNLLKNLNQ